MLRRLAWATLLPLVGACTLLTSFDGATGGVPSNEAGIDGASAGDGPGDAGNTFATDASPSVDTDADAGCIRLPSIVVDRTPDGSAGFSCNLANAMALDGKLAGLDSNSGSNGDVGGQVVSSCFEARFDADIGARVAVHAMVTDSACGGACTGGCAGDPKLKVFAGPASDDLEYLGLVIVERDAGLAPYTLFRSRPDAARVVVICRAVTGSYVDPAIDVVSGDCR